MSQSFHFGKLQHLQQEPLGLWAKSLLPQFDNPVN